MTSSADELVTEFCKKWATPDPEELAGYFTEDAVYHNIPMPAVTGKAAIKDIFGLFIPPAEKIEFEVVGLAVCDHTVFTERVDRFVIAGREVELPVAGVFEIEGGRIKAWRDYFDFATWQRQTGAA